MRKRGTASVSGAYVEFQAAVLKALPRDLSDEAALRWTESGKSLAHVLREALSPDGKPVTIFPVWKTLSIGGATKDELLKRLEMKRISVSVWARDTIRKPTFTTSAESCEVSFVKLKVRDLGFTEMPTARELFDEERLARFGLELCELEDGLYLRLAEMDQPRGTWYWVAMSPITASGGSPHVFVVGRNSDGKQWLDAGIANPDSHGSLDLEIVFRFRK